MRGGPRKGFGGAQPGAGRKPDPIKTKSVALKLTPDQHTAFKALGGSPWLQGLLNLEARRLAEKQRNRMADKPLREAAQMTLEALEQFGAGPWAGWENDFGEEVGGRLDEAIATLTATLAAQAESA